MTHKDLRKIVNDVQDRYNWTQQQIADQLGVPLPTLNHQMLQGKGRKHRLYFHAVVGLAAMESVKRQAKGETAEA